MGREKDIALTSSSLKRFLPPLLLASSCLWGLEALSHPVWTKGPGGQAPPAQPLLPRPLDPEHFAPIHCAQSLCAVVLWGSASPASGLGAPETGLGSPHPSLDASASQNV